MNLLNYTNTLRQKLNFYDKYLKNNFESTCNNPFLKKDNFDITIIWIESEENKNW